MKTFIVSYITTSGVAILNNTVRAESRAEAISDIIGEENIFIILSIVQI